jgi:hypothetical protein
VRADRVYDRWGRRLDGDGDGAAGGDRIERFSRLFGDGDGNGQLGATDREQFRSAFGTCVGDGAYRSWFDFDGDVDGRDNGQFNRRLHQSA